MREWVGHWWAVGMGGPCVGHVWAMGKPWVGYMLAMGEPWVTTCGPWGIPRYRASGQAMNGPWRELMGHGCGLVPWWWAMGHGVGQQ